MTNFVVPFLIDTAIGSVLFVGLLWFSWLLGLGKSFGIDEAHLKAFDAAHFWLNYGLFCGLGISFLVRVGKRAVFSD